MKKAMLLAGLGWGNMPAHMVADELATGELLRINPVGFSPLSARLVLGVAHSTDRNLGPAAAWMVEHLSQTVPFAEENEQSRHSQAGGWGA